MLQKMWECERRTEIEAAHKEEEKQKRSPEVSDDEVSKSSSDDASGFPRAYPLFETLSIDHLLCLLERLCWPLLAAFSSAFEAAYTPSE